MGKNENGADECGFGETKVCPSCKQLKQSSEFYTDFSRKDGLSYSCKECTRQRSRTYRERNLDKARETARKHREKNKEYYSECQKTWYRANHEKKRHAQLKRRLENPELLLLQAAKCRAKNFAFDFDLELNDIVIPTICPVLGIPINLGLGKAIPNSPTIDRIDNSRGYTKNNIIIVSRRANTLKRDATAAELRLIADFYANLRKKTRPEPDSGRDSSGLH